MVPILTHADFQRLTPREREVALLIGHGEETKRIARILNLSTKTVETHRLKIQRRLGLYHPQALQQIMAIYVYRMGPDVSPLPPPEEPDTPS